MSKVLYLQASPRGERSYANRTADAFIQAYRENHPSDEVVLVNVFSRDLPVFDGFVLNAKYAILHGQKHSPEELEAWKSVEAVIREFTSADKYVWAVPMWNFGIPYRLKQYFDVIVQPGYTFSYSPKEGFKGLVVNKPIWVACSRGGEYPAGTPYEAYDLQKKYLEIILAFIGFKNIQSVVVEPTEQQGPEAARARLQAAIAKAREAARKF